MADKRITIPDSRKLRNLRQYKDMSEDEFNAVMEKKQKKVSVNNSMESRIEDKINTLAVDYDLDDLNANDIMMLRALVQALISLEDYEIEIYKLRGEGINIGNIAVLEKLSRVSSDLRADISKFQTDLNITRKYRASDKAESVVKELETLTKKARKFYKEKMSYVLCPECNMLLATIWVHYPEVNNKLTFICNRLLDEDGNRCGHKFSVTTKELMEKHGVNVDHFPESMK